MAKSKTRAAAWWCFSICSTSSGAPPLIWSTDGRGPANGGNGLGEGEAACSGSGGASARDGRVGQFRAGPPAGEGTGTRGTLHASAGPGADRALGQVYADSP